MSPDGVIYGVAAMDSDFDDGPWRSAVMRIGALAGTAVRLDAEPTVIGYIDGLKIESVALRPSNLRAHDVSRLGVPDECRGAGSAGVGYRKRSVARMS